MFVDIHTHNFGKSEFPCIRNLVFSDADNILSTKEIGLFSVGFHPWFADEFSTESFFKLEKLVTDNRIIALGECGLDKYSKVSIDKQLVVFEQQIRLSEIIIKPLIIHCVGRFNELLDLKKKLNPRQLWIIHGFRGKPELAKQVLKSGCSLSFGEYFNQESVRLTPIDKLFMESDESQLPINEIYRTISIIKNCEVGELNAGETLIMNF